MSVSNILKQNQYSNVDIFCKNLKKKKKVFDHLCIKYSKKQKVKHIILQLWMKNVIIYRTEWRLVGDQGLVAINKPWPGCSNFTASPSSNAVQTSSESSGPLLGCYVCQILGLAVPATNLYRLKGTHHIYSRSYHHTRLNINLAHLEDYDRAGHLNPEKKHGFH